MSDFGQPSSKLIFGCFCAGVGCFLEAFFSILYGLSRTPLQAAAAFGAIDIAAQLHGSGGACSLEAKCFPSLGSKVASTHYAVGIYRLAFMPWKFGLVENVSLPVYFSGSAQNWGFQCCLCFVAGWISFMEIGGPDSATINGFSNSISNGFGFIVPHMGLYMRRVTGSWMPHLCATTPRI
eukprot:COSAG04_NODE_224_length_19624_cov_47.932855_15_plen_180_part_00